MGRIDFGTSGFFQTSANTKFEVGRDVTLDGVRTVLEKLSKSASLVDGRVCYVHGKGAKTRNTYIALQRQAGVKVIFFRSLLSWSIRFLQIIVASHEGLVRIDDLSFLPKVFIELMHLSAVGVYCVSARFEAELVRLASESGKPRQHDLGVKVDPGYAYYIVDADSTESPTGMIEIISHGTETPSDMIPYC